MSLEIIIKESMGIKSSSVLDTLLRFYNTNEFILQLRKLRLREGKSLVQGHIAS